MKLLKKFSYAISGLITGFKQSSILFVVFWAVVAITVFTIIGISYLEWLVVIVMIALVWLCEWVNSIIEQTIDYISQDYSEQAKKIKDLSAGLVLLSGLMAFVVGVMILVNTWVRR